jgi:MscS family membrane protein
MLRHLIMFWPSPVKMGTPPLSMQYLVAVHRNSGWALLARHLFLAALVAAANPAVAVAQRFAPPASRVLRQDTVSAAVEPAVEAHSPRADMERFLELARRARYQEAAAYLIVPESLADRRTELARQLKAVLDQRLWIDLERLSPLATGDTADGLPPNVEQLGTIPGADGVPQPVRLVRTSGSGEPVWRFSAATVTRVPAWYQSLDDRWLREHLPEALLRSGPLDLLWWQWIALVLLGPVAGLLGYGASRALRAGLAALATRTRATWDDALIASLGAPLTAACTLGFVAGLLPWLALTPPAAAVLYRAIWAGVYLAFFWALMRLVDVGIEEAAQSQWAQASPSSRALLPLGRRVAKIAVAGVALIAILSILGYPVASLIAGLGLGGLALALAAQKTVENLFGTFSIGIDQPFREGDTVRIEDVLGTVEQIGLRSTRIRTLDRSLVSIPNGKLSEMRIESLTARDRLRLSMTIGLVYQTTAAQLRTIRDGFERVLRGHPKTWQEQVIVRFAAFADSSLNIEVMAWFETSDWNEFREIREQVLFQFMEVVEQAGSAFAYPTRTVFLENRVAPADTVRLP